MLQIEYWPKEIYNSWGLRFELCNVIMNFQTNLEETKTENRMKTKIYFKQNNKTIKNDWTARTVHLLI